MKSSIKNPFLFLLLLPFVILLPFLGNFIFSKGSDFNDLVISHAPNAVWIQQSLRQWAQIPLWSPAILSGYPFMADPLSGLHYPPGWLALLFPQPFGLNLVMGLHLLLSSVGMYRFLKSEELDELPAVFGGLAFGLLPKLFAHLGAGHVSLVYAVSWTPWLLWAQRSGQARWRPALVLGLIALADPRWAALAGLVWLCNGFRVSYSKKDGPANLIRWVLWSVGGAILAGCLAAALLLPLAEYTNLSTRASMSAADNLTLSLPPVQLLGVLTPSMGGTAEWAFYPGGLVLVLAMLGLSIPMARRQVRFWWLLALAGIIYALGSSLPGFELLTRIPGFSLLRVPPRALFISGYALVTAAAMTLHVLVQNPATLQRLPRFNPLLLGVALAFFLLLFTGAGWAVTKTFPLRFAWGGLALVGALAYIFLYRAGRILPRTFLLFSLTWLVIDLAGSNMAGFDFRASPEIQSQGAQAAAYLRESGSGTRVYSPSYSISQLTAIQNGLELADGVDPLQLSAYSSFLRKAGGIQDRSYSVTLPPFVNGEPALDNREAKPSSGMLGLLRVGYVAAEFDLKVEGLKEVARFGTTRIYKNASVLPAAWVQSPDLPPGQGTLQPVILTKKSNTVQAMADGPGLLVFSEIAYPGWIALIDGQPVLLQSVLGLLRGIDLPAGPHRVDMVFEPASLRWGFVISAAAWLTIGALELLKKRRLA